MPSSPNCEKTRNSTCARVGHPTAVVVAREQLRLQQRDPLEVDARAAWMQARRERGSWRVSPFNGCSISAMRLLQPGVEELVEPLDPAAPRVLPLGPGLAGSGDLGAACLIRQQPLDLRRAVVGVGVVTTSVPSSNNSPRSERSSTTRQLPTPVASKSVALFACVSATAAMCFVSVIRAAARTSYISVPQASPRYPRRIAEAASSSSTA